MELDLITIISLIITYITTYSMIYFLFIYLTKDRDREESLFHPNVTIIVPTHNEEKNISRAIESIINQEYKGRIELLVMDDGSTDNTKKIVNSYPGVKYFQSSPKGRPQGKTKTINKGVKIAKHGIIGILDADSYLSRDALKKMIGEFENLKTGAVVPLVKVHEPRNFLERMQVIEYTLSMCLRKLVSNTGGLFLTHGVGTLFRKKALKEINYFEEDTLTEDLNVGLKLIKAGYQIKSTFKAIGYTVVPKTTKHVIKQRLRWNGGLFENSYWFREMFFNKKYGNLGMFVLPINLIWSFVTVYAAGSWIRDTLNNIFNDLRSLLITEFDWPFFFQRKINAFLSFNINEFTIITIISFILFLVFYSIMSRKSDFTFKESLINYLFMPFYFTIFLAINALTVIASPLYLLRKGGKPWLTDRTT
jgi:cellulose synthase/poly-beta-1,6-N-acetylglucosamine synthase-like glycosyltransferase